MPGTTVPVQLWILAVGILAVFLTGVRATACFYVYISVAPFLDVKWTAWKREGEYVT